ncbi:MAG: tetratricopeptide repeat protein [Nitrospirae bacterium]|nr:tetratricopeptide repeat protein [Nitrospirota bacterium]
MRLSESDMPLLKRQGAKLMNLALICSVFVLAFIYSFRRMSDTDLWGHLKCGEYFFTKGSILRTHYFNCSWPDFPYLNHEWLFQAVIYRVYSWFGEYGLITLQVLLILSAFFLLYRILRLYSDNITLIALVLILGIVASSHRFALRPQHFSYVFLLYYLFSLHAYQQGRKRFVYALPFIMILWVNMHAESLWGIFVPAVFIGVNLVRNALVSDKAQMPMKTLLAVFACICAATLLNPFGYKTVIWPLLVMKEQFAGVEELLAPTSARYLPFWIFFALVAAAAVSNFRKLDPAWLILSASFAVIAWTANRGIPHFVFVSSPLLIISGELFGIRLRKALQLPAVIRFSGKLVFLVMVMLLAVTIVSSPVYFQKYDNISYPEGAIAFIKKHGIKGNVLNSHPWGGYLIWNSYPDIKPYIDGRFFHKRFYNEYYHLLSAGAGWQDILARYDISMVLMPYSAAGVGTLNDRLFSSVKWRLVYWDDICLLYLRENGLHGEVIGQFGQGFVNPDRQLYDYSETDPGILAKAGEAAEKNLSQTRSYRALIVTANIFFNSGRYAMALERYRAALQFEQGNNAWLYFRLTLCSRYLGDVQRAEQYLEKCLLLAPDFPEGQRMLQEMRRLRSA